MRAADLVQDIEEPGELLEEDTAVSWVGAHKKVVFAAIDYNLKDLAEQVAAGELDLQPQYQVDALRSEFRRVLTVVETAFGEHAFARYQPERGQWRHQVVAAIYDAEMLAAQHYDVTALQNRTEQILDATRKLFSQKRFREATEAATNATTAFRYRVAAVNRLLSRYNR